jgi:hypothetical protein
VLPVQSQPFGKLKMQNAKLKVVPSLTFKAFKGLPHLRLDVLVEEFIKLSSILQHKHGSHPLPYKSWSHHTINLRSEKSPVIKLP